MAAPTCSERKKWLQVVALEVLLEAVPLTMDAKMLVSLALRAPISAGLIAAFSVVRLPMAALTLSFVPSSST